MLNSPAPGTGRLDTDAAGTAVLNALVTVLHTPAEQLDRGTRLADLDWDSLSSLEVLQHLEADLGISFDLRSFHAARTAGDLACLADTVRPATAAPAA